MATPSRGGERLARLSGHVAASVAIAPSPASGIKPSALASGASMAADSLSPAAHRQTKYVPGAPLSEVKALPIPPMTSDLEQAKRDLSEYGMCLVKDAIEPDLLRRLREKLDRQAEAEAKAFNHYPKGKNAIGQLTNKGKVFTELIDHDVTDALVGYMLGKNFLLSSLTGHFFRGPAIDPQILHRDQGFVPATADFPAVCNVFWLLDDFEAANGGTHVVPGSHRWPAEALVRPPPREMVQPLTAPAGAVFAWDGRLWHSTGSNTDGRPRRAIDTNFCLPWMRQQENWGVTLLQEVLEGANDKVRARLGMFSYGTLGLFGGGAPRPTAEWKLMGKIDRELGNSLLEMPDALVGEDAVVHPVNRPTRTQVDTTDRAKPTRK